MLVARATEQLDDLSAPRRMTVESSRFDPITYARSPHCLLDRHGFTSSSIKPPAGKERIGVTG
ncbi:MAG: hypothetical protein ACXVXL_27275 [Solirubrobacteraceae bacterium]